MGGDNELRRFSRSALVAVEDLAEGAADSVYALTYPEGGLELGETEPQGEVVVWVYSRITNLIESCGDGQPYVRVTRGGLEDFVHGLDVPVLAALDVWHPEGVRYAAPEVDDLEPLDPLAFDPPETSTVWVPVRPGRRGDKQVTVELHSVTPGQPLLLVYDSLEALLTNCGPYQAACSIRPERIESVAHQTGARGVVFNAALVDEAKHARPVRDWARESREKYLK